jgi:hypothetical protein
MSNNFYVNKFTDSELIALHNAVDEEIHRREERRKQEREMWIENHYTQFQRCDGDYKVVGNTVVVAFAWRDNVKMATATTVKGDVFNLRTGIAVAYAKARGERIPEFL